MKKFLLTLALLSAVTVLTAQSLNEIVKNFTVANKLDKISSLQSIKLTGNMSMMGMDMPMVIYMKNPNKIKSVATIGGQEMIQVFDGEKGYMINPMTGSATPVELGPEEARQLLRSNVFQNYLDNYLKNNQLTLEGVEDVNGKPAFKIKASIEGGNVIRIFIDKSSYLIVKTVADVRQGGTAISLESVPSDYTETNGVILPMTTTTSAAGMQFVYKYTEVKVNEPMEDDIFKVR
jgi:outer membrane lipoprotein-sorting protein